MEHSDRLVASAASSLVGRILMVKMASDLRTPPDLRLRGDRPQRWGLFGYSQIYRTRA